MKTNYKYKDGVPLKIMDMPITLDPRESTKLNYAIVIAQHSLNDKERKILEDSAVYHIDVIADNCKYCKAYCWELIADVKKKIKGVMEEYSFSDYIAQFIYCDRENNNKKIIK